jgi:hypothetical protein
MVRAQRARRVGEAQKHPRRSAAAALAPVPRGLQRPLRRGAAAQARQAVRRERSAPLAKRRRGDVGCHCSRA